MRWNRVFALTIMLLAIAGVSQAGVWDKPAGNVYFGDFHIHTEFSLDAFMANTPQGRYAIEAGQYALYCSKLDFYAVTDHAELMTRRDYWPRAIKAARSINKIGNERKDAAGDPKIVAFTGWEWSSSGPYGHKNVITKWDTIEKLPPSPIRYVEGIWLRNDAVKKAGKGVGAMDFFNGIHAHEMLFGMRYAGKDLTWLARRPKKLYKLMRDNCLEKDNGCDAVIIPHGNAWRNMPMMQCDWQQQIDTGNYDPELESLVEVYSQHGNSEEYKYYPPNYKYYRNGVETPKEKCSVEYVPQPDSFLARAFLKTFMSRAGGVDMDIEYPRKPLEGCEAVCQEPTASYMPCCWRAGEIVKERCVNPESEFCKEQVALAKQTSRPFTKNIPDKLLSEIKAEYRDDPGKVEYVEWQTCGQCRDCWQPAYNYTPDGSVQKALSSAYFDANGDVHHYKFGFIGSTDNHSSWGGSVKETKRMTEPFTANAGRAIDFWPQYPGWERGFNFLNPGGLVAIVSPRRTRDDLWDSFKQRQVYSTSGPRMEVWARAETSDGVIDMGSESKSQANPTFHIRANGAFEELENCPYDDEPDIKAHLSKDEFMNVCFNQCYRTTDKRIGIARIEVIKILQPMTQQEDDMDNRLRSEDNPAGLIMDPYHVENLSSTAVEWSWTDDKFADEPKGRSVAYYFRIIQEPTEGYNCNPSYLLEEVGKSCDGDNPDQLEIEKKINPQDGSEPIKLNTIPDACYTDINDPKTFCEERAWTSPFYIVKE